MNGEVYVTPLVRKTAERLKVDLSSVQGTGVGGRVRVVDVNAAAGVVPSSSRLAMPVMAASSSQAQEFSSVFTSGARVKLDPYGASPLLDDLRQASPASFAAASKEGQPPTLFESGNLPPFTASGVDPRELMKLPFGVRHTAAAEPDRGRLFRLFADAAAGDYDGALDDGARQYQQRLLRWGIGPTVRAT